VVSMLLDGILYLNFREPYRRSLSAPAR
jgi:hypothetical protein